MDGLTLLLEAEEAGLRVEADGDQLQIRGPKNAVAIVRKIAKHKADVLAAMRHDWLGDALKLLASCPDAKLRSDLHDLFEETAATLEFMQGNSAERAEMLAFGLLVFEILRRGMDCPSAKHAGDAATESSE